MKIRHKKVSIENINLSREEVIEVTKNALLSMTSPGTYLDKKCGDDTVWLCYDTDNHCGSPDTNYLRAATDIDIAIFKVLNNLKEIKQ